MDGSVKSTSSQKNETAEGRTRLSSVTTAIRLLKAFSSEDQELGISELAKRLGVAKSTVHRLATSLLAEGLLEQNPETDRYRLGIALFSLGALVRRRIDVSAEAKAVLHDLRAELMENVRLAVLDEGQVVYVYDFDSPHPVRLRSHTGLSKPAFCTAEGLVLLAGQPDSVIDRALAGDLVARTPKTETDPAKIRTRIDAVRRIGHAVEDEESEVGMRCIAAPIRSGDGRVVAAIGIAGPRVRLRKQRFPALTARAVEAASEVSGRLGWHPGLRLGA
jgi:IclR family KDG regulon transcriptional repressor